MLPRSTGRPLFIGLGAAAVIAAGAVPMQALAADEIKPAIEVSAVPKASVVKAGSTVPITVTLTAANGDVRQVWVKSIEAEAISGPGEPTLAGECHKGCLVAETLTAAKEETRRPSVTVPESIKEKTVVEVRITVTYQTSTASGPSPDEGASDEPDEPGEPGEPEEPQEPENPSEVEKETVVTRITYTPLASSPSPTPTKTKTSKPTPGPTRSSGGGGSSGGGSSGTGSSYTPPKPNGSFDRPSTPRGPKVSLPSIAPPSPSVAPGSPPVPENRLRNNKAPVAQDLTFERMASTQIAWLAALLVVFSLLLTQLRLGRRRAVAVPAQAARVARRAGRSKGQHRRPRRGLFGK